MIFPSVRWCVVGLVLCLATCGGCRGPKLQGFGGDVTYDGKPLKGGIITFIPDAEQGNLMGASSIASIKDGRYELPQKQGISGGWYRMIVESTEKVAGTESDTEKHRFPPYTISHEFKPGDMTFDLDIPKQK